MVIVKRLESALVSGYEPATTLKNAEHSFPGGRGLAFRVAQVIQRRVCHHRFVSYETVYSAEPMIMSITIVIQIMCVFSIIL